MKQSLAILLAFLIGAQLLNAQGSKELDSFKEKVMPKYSKYFNQASLTESGQLGLSALDQYKMLSSDARKAIMVVICTEWPESYVIVSSGSKKELWGRNTGNGTVRLMDTWDLNASQLTKMPETSSTLHPWFFYIGGQIGGDTQKNVNMSVNTRLGFFLLLNRWDMAATLSTGLSGNIESEPSYWSNIGLMSRVHFPIRKIGISPNIGGEMTYTPFGNGAGTISGAAVAGISWYIGSGSLDLGVSVGKQITAMGGFTFAPRAKGKKLE